MPSIQLFLAPKIFNSFIIDCSFHSLVFVTTPPRQATSLSISLSLSLFLSSSIGHSLPLSKRYDLRQLNEELCRNASRKPINISQKYCVFDVPFVEKGLVDIAAHGSHKLGARPQSAHIKPRSTNAPCDGERKKESSALNYASQTILCQLHCANEWEMAKIHVLPTEHAGERARTFALSP